MKPAFSFERFEALPVVGILRGFTRDQVQAIVPAAERGGLTTIEITMNTAGAAAQIRDAAERASERLNVGAGTVTSLPELEEALEAGASFVVTPALAPDVIGRCVDLGIPVFPGAFTPTEIARAWELGAAMVKVFPAGAAGPGYIRSLKAPFPRIKLLPTGGVDLNTLPQYLKAGADGFGVGSPLFARARVEAGDWEWIENQCRAFVQAYQRG